MDDACNACSPGFLRLRTNGPCIFLPGALAACNDGVKNGNEAGVDCGGPVCAACATASTDGASTSITVAIIVLACTSVFCIAFGCMCWLNSDRRKSAADTKTSKVAPQTHMPIQRQQGSTVHTEPLAIVPAAAQHSIDTVQDWKPSPMAKQQRARAAW